jgi:hypothetical protein
MKLPLILCLLLASVNLLTTPVRAQENTPEIENHPAVKVVKEYLTCMLEQNWPGSAALVEPKSLTDLRDDYVKRVKGTASLDDEKMVVEKFKVANLEGIQKMTGIEFYIAYHQLLKERTPADPAIMEKVRKSMKLRILSVAMEDEKLCHILVRTKHNNDRVNIESLEVLSMVKIGDKWMVGLNEQTPKVTPLQNAPTQATPEPVKEAPKPAPVKPEPTKPSTTKKK